MNSKSFILHSNLEARRQYQVKYNRVKRATRRKLSKAGLDALRDRKRREVDGDLP